MGSVRLIPIYLMNRGVRINWHKIPAIVGMDASTTLNTLTSIYLGEDGEPCPSVLQSGIVVIVWIRRKTCMELPVRKIWGLTNRAARKAGMCGTPRVDRINLGVLNSDTSGQDR